jgi:hypothetical protein
MYWYEHTDHSVVVAAMLCTAFGSTERTGGMPLDDNDTFRRWVSLSALSSMHELLVLAVAH